MVSGVLSILTEQVTSRAPVAFGTIIDASYERDEQTYSEMQRCLTPALSGRLPTPRARHFIVPGPLQRVVRRRAHLVYSENRRE
jgi:hypothetical protein